METVPAWLMSIDAAVPGGAARVLSVIVLSLGAWILAKAGTALFIRVMRRFNVSRWISAQTGLEAQRIKTISESVVYYGMLVALGVAILDFVNLAPVASAATTLLAGVLSSLPGIVKALGIMLVAWILARASRAATKRLFETAAIEAKIAKISGEHVSKTELTKRHDRTTRTAGEIVYYSFMVLGTVPALAAR